MHVHSLHSRHPGEWILQRLGASESYTPVETIYKMAKAQGNTYVTIPDDNTIDGALELCRMHPEDCFVSVEATAYFPEDGCKIHVLCYDITPEQFAAIQRARENIYNLRDYLRGQNIPCSVAHATYSVNKRLTLDHVEKLLVLFDVFEGINGTRGHEGNDLFQEVLQNITPEDIKRLSEKHGIDPWGATSWHKGVTGGSDDHAGLFVGHTWTCAEAGSKEEFINALRNRQTTAGGRYGDYKALAYGIYKIASEYMHENRPQTTGMVSMLSSILFDPAGPSFKEKLIMRKLGLRHSKRDKILSRFINNLYQISQDKQQHGANWQIEAAYEALGALVDDFTGTIAQSVEDGINGKTSQGIMKYISSLLPAIVFSAPFVSTLRVLNQSRDLHNQLSEEFHLEKPAARRTLWITDTFADLNGVAVTMQEISNTARAEGLPLLIVGCPTNAEKDLAITRHILRLPCVYEFTPEFYNAYTARLPAILKSIDMIAKARPDKIVISTPGPVGLVGLAAARLLGIPCEAVYHTDFAMQAKEVTGDAQVVDIVSRYINWFYQRVDKILVPSRHYMMQLADSGLDISKMKLFRRGLDSSFAQIDELALATTRKCWFREDAFTLCYAGRIGKEKNLELLADLFSALRSKGLPVRLVLAGDGPERKELEKKLSKFKDSVIFTGRMDRHSLKCVYLLSDLLVFPSTTDTFGMTVLEAQTLGLPALVTKSGGPQEIIIEGETGYSIDANDAGKWVATCRKIVELRMSEPASYRLWRDSIKKKFAGRHSWKALVEEITEKTDNKKSEAESAYTLENQEYEAVETPELQRELESVSA